MGKLSYIYLIVLLFTAFLTRGIAAFNSNPIFGFDQGREWLAAKDILINHKFTLIGTELGAGSAGLNGIFHGPIYYYMLTVPFAIGNGHPAAGTWFMVFFGILTVFAGYLLGRKVFNSDFFGFLTGLFIVVSPMIIPQSRFLWSPHIVSLFLLVHLFYVFKIKEDKARNIFLSAFFSAFLYNFEFAIAIPLITSLIAYSLLIFKTTFRNYIYLFLGFFVGFSPMILFELRHGFMGLKGLLGYLFLKKENSSSLFFYVQDHLNSFVSNFSDSFPEGGFIPPALGLTAFLIIGIFLVIKEYEQKRKFFFIYILSLPFITFLILSFLRNTVWSYYLTHLTFVYILLFVYLLFFLYKKKFIRVFLVLIFYFGIIVYSGLQTGIEFSIKDFYDPGGGAKLNGKIKTIDYIYKDANGKKFGLFVFSPPVYTYPYDYILEWYGKEKFGYIPPKEKKQIFYLLMEVDWEKPWSYKGWQETVIKDGQFIFTKSVTPGLIVEKRIR